MAREFSIRELDWYLISLVIILLIFGFLALYSAQVWVEDQSKDFQRQLLWFCFGIIAAITVFLIPTKVLFAFAYVFYGIAFFLLIAVLKIGVGKAAASWIRIGGMCFQPSEFAKIAIVIALARYLSQCKLHQNRLKDLIIIFLLIIPPIILIKKQPDLGTSLVLLFVNLPLLFWAGIQPFTLFVLVSPVLSVITSFKFNLFLLWMGIVAAVLYFSRKTLLIVVGLFLLNIAVGLITDKIWDHLEDYQKKRIEVMFKPLQYAKGSGYQVVQSVNAIGSGGFTGKGYLKGTQTKLKYLPMQNTDFIFSIIGEEFGFIGIFIILLVYFLLISRMVTIAVNAHERFESLLVIGFTSVIGFHIIVNTAMTVNIMPVTGLPLPFLSYGGSFLVTLMTMIGIVLRIEYKRIKYY
jgi:rod shape determining protein RodA